MNNHLKHVAYLAVWTFTVVVVWVGLSIYFQSIQPQVDPEILKEAEPIPATFDREALQGIEGRKQVPFDLAAPIQVAEINPPEASGAGVILSP